MTQRSKKIFRIRLIIAFIILIVVVVAFGIYAGWFSKYHDISTQEELYAMEKGKSYRLTADIDLEGNYWTPKKVKAFDGNGHTIRNCTINEMYDPYVGTTTSSSYSTSTAFFSEVEYLENVTFENIIVMATDASKIAIVVAEGRRSSPFQRKSGGFKNIAIKGCSITGNAGYSGVNIGLLCARGYTDIIDECLIDNCTIRCNVTNGGNFKIGGLCGTCSYEIEITNNTIQNCNIEIISPDVYGILNVGGIVGHYSTTLQHGFSLSNCLAKNNTFKIEANSNSDRATRIGGIIGYSGEADGYNGGNIKTNGIVSQCASIGNTFEVAVANNYSLGGIVGRNDGQIENCLSDNNNFVATSNYSSVTANLGGLCGVSYNTIKNSISQNCEIRGTSGSGNEVNTAGFIGSSEASIAYCAVNNNVVSGGNSDIFTSKSNMVFNCYVRGRQIPSNINNIPILEDEWNSILTKLALDTTIWGQVLGGDLQLKGVGNQNKI
ncbi:MAG: hypothetical protein J1F36_04515 [Clostridiales bacterium]|nr:hypothetical protein [Clostridiales bacterium]